MLRVRSTCSTSHPAPSHFGRTVAPSHRRTIALSLPRIAQPSQRRQVFHVERIGDDRPCLLAALRFFGFNEDWQPRESAVVKQPPEWLFSDAAMPDVFVPIDAAPARFLRVVAVKDLQPIDPDEAIEGVERLS